MCCARRHRTGRCAAMCSSVNLWYWHCRLRTLLLLKCLDQVPRQVRLGLPCGAAPTAAVEEVQVKVEDDPPSANLRSRGTPTIAHVRAHVSVRRVAFDMWLRSSPARASS